MEHADKAAKPKKRRTGLIVFLCILLLLLAVLGGVLWRYRAGLAILIDNFGKSSEQVSAEREDYEKKTQELLDKLSGGGITLAALSALIGIACRVEALLPFASAGCVAASLMLLWVWKRMSVRRHAHRLRNRLTRRSAGNFLG